jgi:hypothetical protein
VQYSLASIQVCRRPHYGANVTATTLRGERAGNHTGAVEGAHTTGRRSHRRCPLQCAQCELCPEGSHAFGFAGFERTPRKGMNACKAAAECRWGAPGKLCSRVREVLLWVWVQLLWIQSSALPMSQACAQDSASATGQRTAPFESVLQPARNCSLRRHLFAIFRTDRGCCTSIPY